MFGFYFCYAAAEKVPGDWLATLAISRGASDAEGAHITGVYWGSLTGGRLLAVLVASWASTSQMITANFACCISACVLLLSLNSAGSLYASGAGIGLGLASLYPSGILLAQTRIPLNSKYISR
jgi:fucose permease